MVNNLDFNATEERISEKKQKERKKDSMNASFVPKFVIFRKHSFLEKMFDKMWRYYFTLGIERHEPTERIITALLL